MKRTKWNRSAKRDISKDDPGTQNSQGYKVSRVTPRLRKPKHPGFTITSSRHPWMFDKTNSSGGI